MFLLRGRCWRHERSSGGWAWSLGLGLTSGMPVTITSTISTVSMVTIVVAITAQRSMVSTHSPLLPPLHRHALLQFLHTGQALL